MVRCRACGRQVRATRLAVVLGRDGKNKGGRVCRDCERGGMLVVASTAPVVIDAETSLRREEKEVLAPYVARLASMLLAYQQVCPSDDAEAEFIKGKITGIESAIALLNGGRT